MNRKKGTPFSVIPLSEPLQVTDTGSVETLTVPTANMGGCVLIMQNITTTDTATATNIHYVVGGTTDPSATVGFLLEDGDAEVRWDFSSDHVPAIKVYLSSGAVLQYQWFIPL